jgi:hypothetical protein
VDGQSLHLTHTLSELVLVFNMELALSLIGDFPTSLLGSVFLFPVEDGD